MVLASPNIQPRPNPTRSDLMKACLTALSALVLIVQLTACGGGSSSSPSSGTPTPTAAKGIATPKSVSVVTAN
jgi:hypothetical protein